MRVDFSRDTYHAYMILDPVTDREEGFEEQMLVNQDTGCLLRFHPQETDGIRKYYYEITGMMDFASCVNRKEVSYPMLEGMLLSLIECCDALSEYLLQPDSLLLEPDKVYLDVDMTRMHFAYLPGYPGDFLAGLQHLTECLLSAADHRDRRCVMKVYELYRLVREPEFSAASLRRLIGDEEENKSSMESKPFMRMDEDTEDSRQERMDLPLWGDRRQEEPFAGKDLAERLGGRLPRILCYGAGAVICLAAACAYRFGWLSGISLRIGVGEKYLLAGFLFAAALILFTAMKLIERGRKETGDQVEEGILQKDEDFWAESDYPGGHYSFTDWSEYDSDQTVVLSPGKSTRLVSMDADRARDAVIPACPAVLGCRAQEAQVILPYAGISRRHALLEQEGGRYYLSDLGSTNGTWLNGQKLRPNEKKALVHEDLILFADLSFRFCSVTFDGDGR